MEVLFLDVGQGASNLLLLGNREAIVIDGGGRNDRTLLQALDRFAVARVVRLIVFHSHEDHAGGAASLLSQYAGTIDELWVLDDTRLMQSRLWERIEQQLQDGLIAVDQLCRLERTARPKLTYANPDGRARLSVFSPRFSENLFARRRGQPNATSAILRLEVGERNVLFTADSELDQWRQINRDIGEPLRCDLLAVPHHGGDMRGDAAALRWLYSDAIDARLAVISVGTSNTSGHPREDVVRALTASGAYVICTQLTRRCHDTPESLRPGVLRPHVVGRSRPTADLTSAGNSRNLACGGTVVAELSSDEVVIHRLDAHRRAVDRLAASPSGHPMCRDCV